MAKIQKKEEKKVGQRCTKIEANFLVIKNVPVKQRISFILYVLHPSNEKLCQTSLNYLFTNMAAHVPLPLFLDDPN